MPPQRPPRRGTGKPGGKPPARGSGKPPARGSGRPGERRDGPPRKASGSTGKPPARGGKPPAKRTGSPARSTGRPEKRTDRSARGRPSELEGSNRPKKQVDERTKSWGGVAKRGVGKLKPSEAGTASAAWREAAKESDKRERGRMGGKPPAWEPEEWIDDGAVRDEATRAVRRGTAPQRPERSKATLPDDVQGEVAREAGPTWAGRVQDRLQDAAGAYERERFRDALRIVAPLAERAPGSAAIRELHGLTLYRLGRWRAAMKELEVAELLGGSVDHHPVLMDCSRALGNHTRVRELWDELRRGGAGVEVQTEGRIVLSGSLADQGKVREAIAELEHSPTAIRRPKEHHLRLWYALAALYERAGEVPRARGLFRQVLEADPEFGDVVDRYEALT